MKTSKRLVNLLALGAVTLLWCSALAAEANNNPDTMKIRKTMKAVSGQISSVGDGFLAVVYKKTKDSQFEIAFYMTEATRFERIKSAAQLKAGDMVRVAYEEYTERPDEPSEHTTLTAKQVSLLRPATDQLGSREGAQ